jgi:16S rRNA (guanine1516-N2)-methyltransferase
MNAEPPRGQRRINARHEMPTPAPGAARVAIRAGDRPDDVARASELARRLHLPLIADAAAPDLILDVTAARLSLSATDTPTQRAIAVEFVAGPLGYARRRNRFGMLFRAIGVRGGAAPRVIDATAGLGHDAFLLATSGCQVNAIERQPVLAEMLHDGIARTACEPTLYDLLMGNLRVVVGDARDVLPACAATDPPEVIYLDPMFPQRTKSALVKKEMRVLRGLVGDDDDAAALFDVARAVRGARIVVKRMRHAPPLASGVTHTLAGRAVRYDVYAPRR